MPDWRESRWWDKQYEEGRPDCRLRYSDREKDLVLRGRMPWERVYCANCGTPGGLVTAGNPHIFYVCNECVVLNGPPPGCHEVNANGSPCPDGN